MKEKYTSIYLITFITCLTGTALGIEFHPLIAIMFSFCCIVEVLALIDLYTDEF